MSSQGSVLIDLAVADDLAAVGGKAYNLGRLKRLGLPTPAGAVIPDGIFQSHLVRAGVKPDALSLLAGLDDLPRARIASAAERIRRKIVATPLDRSLVTALSENWQQQWQGAKLAVRSSAVGEDGLQASFAGQLNSSLNVSDQTGLERAIKDTWSSLFALRVLLYARHHKLRAGHVGVIVQPQVEAQLSGVLFTRDPSGQRGDALLAEYCTGLGEQVVNGSITPSRLRIQRADLELTHEHLAAAADQLDPTTTKSIQAIARMALTLEAQEGIAQDIEWCVDSTGKPVLVQSRPATRISAPSSKVHWSNANIAENFPDPVSPLLFSIVQPGYSAYFRNLGLGFGMSRQRIAAMAQPLAEIVGLQGGRLYYNLSNIHSLLQMMPAGRRLVEFFNLFVGAADIPPPSTVRLGVLARGIETLRIGAAICWQYLPIQRRIRRFEARVDRFAARTDPQQLASKSADALLVDLRGFLNIRLNQWNDAALADTAAMVCYGLLKALLARHLPGNDHASLHNDLLKGLPGLASAEPVIRLWALAEQIAANEALNKLFDEADAGTILERLRDAEHAEFSQAFYRYLDRWGFRSSGELMLTKPTPGEDPRPVLRLLQAYVQARTDSPAALSQAQGRQREEATREVARQLTRSRAWRAVPLVSRASRFRMLLRATQGAIKLRERARMKQALLYTRLRHIVLQLGDRLVERGTLGQRDEIFLLTSEEVLKLAADGAPQSAALANRIETRRQAMLTHQAWEPPDRLALPEGEQWQPEEEAPERANEADPLSVLKGNGACGGSVSGCAAVVLDVAEADRVQAGQILVTRQTDPGWATVFFLVKGLVIERGGMLSHGAIIAREYGIPAVVGVPDATRLIGDGDHLRVDGDQGRVELNGQ